VDSVQTSSLSVYRGQSRAGQGEGPGKTILHGEQYMRVDPELYRAELLDTIRPWMTLDSDPADHQRLNDNLEAWSLFPAGDYLFVVQLVSAGTYDRRAAYFAHGRAWKARDLSPGVDPGLHLGRSEAFDPPWRDDAPAARAPETIPILVRPEQVSAEQKTATLFLGHLLQALAGSQPLIIAAPVAEFASRSPLHALVSFCRAGLPAALRRECRIRVYSRFPDLFLRHLNANLLVIPEDAATAALTARPGATLLDRQGRKLAGKDLSVAAEAYAAAVVERAIGIPEGLPHFSERLGDRTPDDPREIQITYNVAFAMSGATERRAELLQRYLPRAAEKLGPGLNWNRLIRPAEWGRFPSDALLDQLLMASAEQSEARRELTSALEDGVSRLGLNVDARLAEWWDPESSAKVRRLLELLTHRPPLISSRAAAQRTIELPLDRLARTGMLRGVIQAEAENGYLPRRAHETNELARGAEDAEIFAILSRATSGRSFSPEWAHAYVRSALPAAVNVAAQRWLDEGPRFFTDAWGDVPLLLLDRLRQIERLPAELALPVRTAADATVPAENLETYLRLAEVMTRIDPSAGDALMERLWRALSSLTGAQQRFIEGIAFQDEWRCFEITRIELTSLLKLVAVFQTDASEARIFAELDRRMGQEPEGTSGALVREGWWFFWRRKSRLERKQEGDAEILRRSAMSWLSSDVWTSGMEATLEAWDWAVGDLPQSLDGDDMVRLRGGAGGYGRWPWIPPFEEMQFRDLVMRSRDLGVLAELAEALACDERSPFGDQPAYQYVLSQSYFKDDVSLGAFSWLLDQDGQTLVTVDTKTSAYLCKHAGHRWQRALDARMASVVALLEKDAGGAIAAAVDPDLWSDGRFLSDVALWMNRKGSLQAIGISIAEAIDRNIRAEPIARPRLPSPELVRELASRGLNQAARLLHPELQANIQTETLTGKVIEAILRSDADAACWQQLAQEVRVAEAARAERHPLTMLADGITRKTAIEERQRLASDGWRVFESAGHKHPDLLAPLMTTPASIMTMTIVPLFGLAASMRGSGALGSATLLLAFAVARPEWRENMWLWRNLLRAMQVYKRHGEMASADDSEKMAVACVFSSLETPKEHSALQRALDHEAREQPDWDLPSEFGEGLS
jgi:hypothetical protein